MYFSQNTYIRQNVVFMKNIEKRVSELEKNVKAINDKFDAIYGKNETLKSKIDDNLMFFHDIGREILSDSKMYSEFNKLINDKKKLTLNETLSELKTSKENIMILANKMQDEGLIDIKYSAPQMPNFIKRNVIKNHI